jgi:hypothetical protein
MPLVGVAPDVGRATRLCLDDRPQPPRQALAVPRVQQDRVERGAEHVILLLVEGAVAEPHGMGSCISGQLVARGLGEVTAPVDPVHDLEAAVVVRLEVRDELHELVGLPVEVQEVQRLQRERRIPDPREAVVPVALAAGRLRERGRSRRHRRAGRHVRQPLDRERRALDRVAPAVVGEPGLTEPAAPVADRRLEARVRLVDVLGNGVPLCPGERAEGLVALRELMTSPHAVALDAQ